MPARAIPLMVIMVVVVGSVFLVQLIFRMSCSFCMLWIMEPEHRNNVDLNVACVIMWNMARSGLLIPIAIIIRPSWLEVEKAMIFLMSFWAIAHNAE